MRPATPADLDELLAVQAEAWQAAFVPILPPDFEVPPADAFRERMAETLASSAVRTALEVHDGAARGWISFGANRDPDAVATVGEVRALFVRPGSWGKGVGAALLGHALHELAGLGYQEATLWSFADNGRANAFYERHGFRRDGGEQRRSIFRGGLEVRYRRPFGPPGYTF